MEAGKDTVSRIGLITGENMMVEGGAKKAPLCSHRSESLDDVEQNSKSTMRNYRQET